MPFEVQIRTDEMHRIAEEGIAAHWKYKEGRVGAARDEQSFQWLRQLLESQQDVRDPQEFMQNLRIELYPEEVYIFTPKGEVKSLPRGATPVDFAYSVHTDVGHQCVGARVNGRMVPLRTRLAERRHRRDPDAARSHAQPRLAQLRRHLARAQQDPALHPRARRRPAASSWAGGCSTRKCAGSASTSHASATTRSTAIAREYGAAEGRRSLRGRSATARSRRARCSSRLVGAGRAAGARARRRDYERRQARARHRRRAEDQGARHRRPDGVPRAVLQPDSRREDRRLHHARQGRVGARRDVPERRQPALRPRAAHRRRVGQVSGRARPTPCG